MKTLQEIWERIGAVETQNVALAAQVGAMQRDSAALAILLEDAGTELPWRITVLTNNTTVTYKFDYAISPAGIPFLIWGAYPCCFDFTATRIGNGWTKVADVPVGDFFTGGLAFNPQGNATRVGTALTTLVIRTYTSGNWTSQVELVGTGTNDPGFPALAFGPGGEPAICYYSIPENQLRYVTKVGGIWSNTVVAPADYSSHAPALRFAPDGRPAIAYRNEADDSLHYASFDGSMWSDAVVEAAAGDSASLAFSPAGQPVISYLAFNGVDKDLRVATSNGVSWSVEVVDSGLGGGYFMTSLAFGPAGRPAVAYSSGASDLKFASRDATLVWTVETVDADGGFDQVGELGVLRFLPSGFASIAYFDNVTDTIKFAERAPYTP